MEAITTYTPVFSSGEVFDEYLASLTEKELADFIESIEEGRKAVARGEYYEWDEVLRYLDETADAIEQSRFPGFEDRLAKLRKKFGNANLEDMRL